MAVKTRAPSMATRAAPRTPRRIPHPSVEDRRARGLAARDRAPLSSHTPWAPAADRPDPVGLLQEQNLTREPDLVPVRHGRMLVSPFTFYRGAATIMAADLDGTPTAGLQVQLCGDAHLSNFGLFASPERELLFGLNDFDETLPGPFEYDVKRLAASFTIAGRNNGFAKVDTRAVTRASVAAYREAMAGFAQMGALGGLVCAPGPTRSCCRRCAAPPRAPRPRSKPRRPGGPRRKPRRRSPRRTPATACRPCRSSASWWMAATGSSASPRSWSRCGTWKATSGLSRDQIERELHDQFRAYRATLQADRRHLLEQFEVVDMARKVVGVGSVGTREFIVLLQGRDQHDPLFLQVKEATRSVLEGPLPKSRYKEHGERVVDGQRLLQAASDIFLGWTKGVDVNRYFYWRQLRDMKGSADVESATPEGLGLYARICGWSLARAHARSGDPIAIAAYLGKRDTFDWSITDFSERYADQNERDYQAFATAIRSGRLEAVEGV